jgi:hypothetical protein
MRRIDEERGTLTQRIKTGPPIGIFVVPVWPYSFEVHLPPARPERTPLFRIDVDDCAHHVSGISRIPAATAEACDAGPARVAPTCAGENRGWVDVGVVEEEARRR